MERGKKYIKINYFNDFEKHAETCDKQRVFFWPDLRPKKYIGLFTAHRPGEIYFGHMRPQNNFTIFIILIFVSYPYPVTSRQGVGWRLGCYTPPHTFGNVRRLCRIFDKIFTLSSDFWQNNAVTVGFLKDNSCICRFLNNFPSFPSDHMALRNLHPPLLKV